MSTTDRFLTYITESRAALADLDLPAVDRAVELLRELRTRNGTVFTVGNGGSASTASHFAADYLKNTISPAAPRPRAIALADSVASITAHANDLSFEHIFSEPLAAFGRSGDILVAISASGNSPNIVRAVDMAHALGMRVIGLSGFAGGLLRERADIGIHIPVNSYEIVEDLHLTVCHLMVVAFRAPVPVAVPAAGVV